MWSKTRQVLTERLADCLKNRVRYQFEVYTTKEYKSEMKVFSILVDGELWYASDPREFNIEMKYLDEQIDPNLHGSEYWKARDAKGHDAYCYADECGILDVTMVMIWVHAYLNEYNIDDCWDGDSYFLKMLAVLDRRTGKRRIQALLDTIDSEPEWFRKFVLLRAEGEGLHRPRQQEEF